MATTSTMPHGTNPFDPPLGLGGGVATAAPPGSSNPFEETTPATALTNNSRATKSASGNSGTGRSPFDGAMTTSSVVVAVEQPSEASWQYLGDLPYRRIPIYQNVQWTTTTSAANSSSGSSGNSSEGTAATGRSSMGGSNSNKASNGYYTAMGGLAQFPKTLASSSSPTATTAAGTSSTTTSSTSRTSSSSQHLWMDARERQQWIQTSTITHVVGCPHGGPLATVTVPLPPSTPTAIRKTARTEIRILTNAGQKLAAIPFPPNGNGSGGNGTGNGSGTAATSATSTSSNNEPGGSTNSLRTASDLFKIGFTEGGILIVLSRDSMCWTYDWQGRAVLEPFYLFGTGGVQIWRAHIFSGGVAALTTLGQVAVAELLSTQESSTYVPSAALSAREIRAAARGEGSATTPHASLMALVTPLSQAAEWATSRLTTFKTLAVLPRHFTQHGHPAVFLSTADHSIVVVPAHSTTEIVDVDCRSRLQSPVVDMVFCPNGRFLACFTEANLLTVVSTSLETKVLDFDTSEGSRSPPTAMQWCGEDSVVLHWKNLGLLMVGPYGDWLRFPYQSSTAVFLVPEMDAVRVVTDSTVELLQRVPPQTANLLRTGSIEPAALLLEAADAFWAGTPSTLDLWTPHHNNNTNGNNGTNNNDGNMHLLHDESAIQVCMEAATKEFDIALQKRLLRAASYGMQYLQQHAPPSDQHRVRMGGPLGLPKDDDNPDHQQEDGVATPTTERFAAGNNDAVLPSWTTRAFVASARKLRILNALRHPHTGWILTAAQYEALTETGILVRLVALQKARLARQIATFLQAAPALQLYTRAAQAAAYVQQAAAENSGGENLSDSAIAERAIAIIQDDGSQGRNGGGRVRPAKGGTSHHHNAHLFRGAYATVALAATQVGRTGVANLLLLLETSVADKVPALLSNGSTVDAMAVATLARDADYIFVILMHLEKTYLEQASNPSEITKSQTTFWTTVASKLTPEAFHTLRRYYQNGTHNEPANHVINLLLRAQRYGDAGATLAQRALGYEDARERQGLLQEASRVFGLGKDTAFDKSCTDDYLELLQDQEVIRTKYGTIQVAPPSSSVTATISAVLMFAGTHAREQKRLFSDAEKLARKFRLPEKRLWHVKVKAFADSGQWSQLRVLADSRGKPPIGYAPFCQAAIRHQQPVAEILRYIERITVPEERYDLLTQAGLWKRALEEAVRLRDGPRIQNVKVRCNNPELQIQADQALSKLT